MKKAMGSFSLETGEGGVRSAEVVGVVGPNATGKTTMVRMIAEKSNPMRVGALWMPKSRTNLNT